jgi:hypothetical protein
MDRMKKLAEAIKKLLDEQFSGSIKINFSQGSIGRVEKFEEFDEASITIAGGNTKQNDTSGGSSSQ